MIGSKREFVRENKMETTIKAGDVLLSTKASARPPPAQLKARDEVSITLHVPQPSVSQRYRFEYKEIVQKWEDAKQIETKENDREIVFENLNPTSSYEFRIYQVFPDGTLSEPSEIAAVDTDVPGCTPGPKCYCSVL
jgi:hypothetical protein